MKESEPRFIGEEITVEFDRSPQLEKAPPCPDRIVWRGETIAVVSMGREWKDYRRRGRMESNMQPAHAAVAERRGSWGVGRYYFQIQTAEHGAMEIYYDRSPKGSDKRKGSWFLYRLWPAGA